MGRLIEKRASLWRKFGVFARARFLATRKTFILQKHVLHPKGNLLLDSSKIGEVGHMEYLLIIQINPNAKNAQQI